MDSPKITYRYYSNPAFCAQSEVTYTQQAPCVSPRISTSPKAKLPPPETTRIPPLGANSPRKTCKVEYDKTGNQRVRTDISDNPLRRSHLKSDGPLRYVNKSITELPPKPGPKPSRYAVISPERRDGSKLVRSASQRVVQTRGNQEYVHRRVNSSNGSHRVEEDLEMFQVVNNSVEVSDSNAEEETEIISKSVNARVLKHRYAEIPDDFDEYSPSKKRIVETNPEEYNVDAPSEEEFKEIPTEIVRNVNGKLHRYAIIPSDDDYEEEIVQQVFTKERSPPTFHIRSPGMPRKQLEATQKLHELLATPKKISKRVVTNSPLKSCTSTPSIRSQFNTPNRALSPDYGNTVFPATPSKGIPTSTPKQTMTPSKSCHNLTSPPLPRRNGNIPSSLSPKAQQKLSYEVSQIENLNASVRKQVPDVFVREPSFTKVKGSSFNRSKDHDRSYEMDRSRDVERGRSKMINKRSTAVITPRMVSQGSESIYSSGTVFSGKSWNLSPGCATLVLAASMMALCGGLTAALSFYIMSAFGSKYYLDIGVLSGCICLILGMLGFRSGSNQLLPNRNYVSGYIVLSVFSLFSCAALLTLLIGGSSNGQETALTDIVGGAVSTLGVLCIFLGCSGAFFSCCCTRTPLDNRVTGA